MNKELLPKIPTSWSMVRIDDIGIVVSGGTPSTKEPEFWGGEIPWITPSDLSKYNEIYISAGRRNLSKIGLEYSSATILPKNSILFSSRAPIGYVAIAKNELSTNQGFKNIILTKHTNPKYIYYYLKTIKEIAEGLASGTTFLELSSLKFKGINVPLAPVEEQNRIVEKIEEIFSELDKSTKEFDNTINTINLQRKNIINRAVKGRLTEDWRKTNQNDIKNSLLKISGLSIKNPQIPKEWLFIQLADLTTKITDGTHHTPSYTKEGYHFISVKDIRDGQVKFEDTKFISEEQHINLTKRCNPEEGDILITKSGTIGRLAIVPKEPEFSLFVSVALIKVDKTLLDSKYLMYCLENYINSINIAEDIKGAVQKNFHLEDIRATRIPYCSLLEQRKIVEEIEVSLQNLQALENDITKAKQGTELLYRKTLKEAFAGRLSSKSEGDTDVFETIEKITEEKASISQKLLLKKTSKKTVRKKTDLLEIIQSNFKNGSFSYYELYEISNLKKETLDTEFVKLEKKKVVQSLFDEKSESIKYKIV